LCFLLCVLYSDSLLEIVLFMCRNPNSLPPLPPSNPDSSSLSSRAFPSMDNGDEYMIYENTPITNSFVSVPEDMGSFNCAAFIAGIMSGVMDSANFHAKVTAHTVSEDNKPDTTVFLVKFRRDVMEREAKLGPA